MSPSRRSARILRPAPLLLALLFLAACTQSGPAPASPDEEVVVRDDVQVLGASARAALESFALDLSSGTGELRFSSDAPGLDALAVGTVVVSEPVDGVAPHGFLQRIERRSSSGGDVVFETAQANLTDVFERAQIDFDQDLAADHVQEDARLMEGVSLTTQAGVGYEHTLDFDEVVLDADGDDATTSDQLRIDGSFHFDARATASIDIDCCGDWFTPYLNRMAAKVRLEEAVDVNLDGAVALGFDERFQVAEIPFGSFTVFAGPVPVVFVIDMVVSVGAQGQIEAQLQVGAEQSSVAQVGIEYTRSNGWDDLNEFSSDFDVAPPQIAASAEARGFLRPQLNVAFYGLAGPYLYGEAFVSADAELYRAPFWRLAGGIDVGIGFEIKLPIVGTISQYDETLAGFERVLQESVDEAPSLEVLRPEDGVRLDEGQTLPFDVVAEDREQARIPLTLSTGGMILDETWSYHGREERLLTDRLCPGSHTFVVQVRDDTGGVTSETLQAVVDNYVPTVDVQEDLFGDVLMAPGFYAPIFAEVYDQSCQVEGNTAELDLVEWYVDGAREGQTRELLYRVPDSASPGETLTVEARYDDGTVEIRGDADLTVDDAEGQTPEGVATINEPRASSFHHYGLEVEVEGYAYHQSTGALTGSNVTYTWELQHDEGSSTYRQVAVGRDATFVPADHVAPPGTCSNGRCEETRVLRLTVTDDEGTEIGTEIEIVLLVEG